MTDLFDIAARFVGDGSVTEVISLGNGLINDTFRVATTESCFVLQRINRRVFPKPEKIMENLAELSEHISRHDQHDVKLRMPAMMGTVMHENCYIDPQGDVWRALEYIENSYCLETLADTGQAEQVGFALGHFHRLLSDLDAERLHDTLPGFHIAPAYLQHYHRVVDTYLDRQASPELEYCTEFIARYGHIAQVLEAAKRRGHLILRVIHGDPKLNNFLFDRDTHAVVSLIDLDTVKPGLIHYDLGDCLRSLCQTFEPVEFDLDICEVVLKHYLAEAKPFLTEYDYHYLYPSIQLIPFELGLRFVTDHMEGNRYFKVIEPGQNLNRAVQQFQLCESILRQEGRIKRLLKSMTR
ncbi:MAG: phosphotransferase enzyme family protein [Gammaproteobacteria bacterium]